MGKLKNPPNLMEDNAAYPLHAFLGPEIGPDGGLVDSIIAHHSVDEFLDVVGEVCLYLA